MAPISNSNSGAKATASKDSNKDAKGKESKGDAMAVDKPVVPVPVKTAAELEAEQRARTLGEIAQNVALLEKAVATSEPRFITRALRASVHVRQALTPDLLASALSLHLKDATLKQELLVLVGGKSEAAAPGAGSISTTAITPSALPQVEMYLGLLVVYLLHDAKHHAKGFAFTTKLVERIHALNLRSLDQIASRIFFYFARFYELEGKLAQVRPLLLNALRTATLRNDVDCQAALVNALLRNYLHFSLNDQADKLISKVKFPESAGNHQLARYMYYLGSIKAIQLDYTASHGFLSQAIRKVPQTPANIGFLQTVHKLAIIVQLLMGEIPERSLFRQPILKKTLTPYFHLTQAVRIGDLAKFTETLGLYGGAFRRDKTYTLILRLRHNVIKTGIRMISLSYSRISLKDICLKLQLDSEQDAEYIVAKAIRDGVIDATIDHEQGFMQSKEILDIYSTTEPQAAFHQRITFCMNVHNESVKALRFPSDVNEAAKELEALNALNEEERKLAKEIEEEGEDGDGDEMDF